MKPAVSLRRSAIADTVYRVQVIDRALSIINLLAASNHPLGAWEAGVQLGLNKSTVHRLLAVVEHHRFGERDLTSGEIPAGPKARRARQHRPFALRPAGDGEAV